MMIDFNNINEAFDFNDIEDNDNVEAKIFDDSFQRDVIKHNLENAIKNIGGHYSEELNNPGVISYSLNDTLISQFYINWDKKSFNMAINDITRVFIFTNGRILQILPFMNELLANGFKYDAYNYKPLILILNDINDYKKIIRYIKNIDYKINFIINFSISNEELKYISANNNIANLWIICNNQLHCLTTYLYALDDIINLYINSNLINAMNLTGMTLNDAYELLDNNDIHIPTNAQVLSLLKNAKMGYYEKKHIAYQWRLYAINAINVLRNITFKDIINSDYSNLDWMSIITIPDDELIYVKAMLPVMMDVYQKNQLVKN